MVVLSELQELCYNQAEAAGFHEDERTVGDGLMLIVSELAEGLEEYRNGRMLTAVRYGENDKPEGYAVELADALIRILDEVHLRGILPTNFETIVMEKLKYNKTRGHRHGGKLV